MRSGRSLGTVGSASAACALPTMPCCSDLPAPCHFLDTCLTNSMHHLQDSHPRRHILNLQISLLPGYICITSCPTPPVRSASHTSLSGSHICRHILNPQVTCCHGSVHVESFPGSPCPMPSVRSSRPTSYPESSHVL